MVSYPPCVSLYASIAVAVTLFKHALRHLFLVASTDKNFLLVEPPSINFSQPRRQKAAAAATVHLLQNLGKCRALCTPALPYQPVTGSHIIYSIYIYILYICVWICMYGWYSLTSITVYALRRHLHAHTSYNLANVHTCTYSTWICAGHCDPVSSHIQPFLWEVFQAAKLNLKPRAGLAVRVWLRCHCFGLSLGWIEQDMLMEESLESILPHMFFICYRIGQLISVTSF